MIVGLALVALLWTSAIVVAATSRAPRLSAAMYAAGALVCHQRPERSFYIEDAQLPVCARCFGLYAGALLGVVAWAVAAGLRGAPAQRAMRMVASRPLRAALM